MSDTVKSYLYKFVNLLVAIFCVALVVVGQKTIGYAHLLLELIGLAGLLIQLSLYNRRFQ
ncbi:MAG: hypothetical protein LKI94_04495 [Sporolactobacillus sp.]|jgi:hypothetical protein|nr:hypothetical protein [Sporolactobacillus sp.]MCI1881430.1 hypothetical protein [Sporolactobacillus sp.]